LYQKNKTNISFVFVDGPADDGRRRGKRKTPPTESERFLIEGKQQAKNQEEDNRWRRGGSFLVVFIYRSFGHCVRRTTNKHGNQSDHVADFKSTGWNLNNIE
jgi:hypothetical protein